MTGALFILMYAGMPIAKGSESNCYKAIEQQMIAYPKNKRECFMVISEAEYMEIHKEVNDEAS